VRFIVAVDCEGVACTVGAPGGSLTASRGFEYTKLQATREADAAARGLFDAGAEQVIVWDNHGGSVHLNYDMLDERCDIAMGSGFEHRWPGLDSGFAGVAMVGYHAMDNTVDAAMAHSFSSATYQHIKVNGQEVGEMAIDGAMAGLHGVPVVFVSSDDKGAAEARRFFPGVETVSTKEAMGWNAVVSKHPQRVVREIHQVVQKAAASAGSLKPFGFDTPIELEFRYKRMDAAQSASRGYRRGERVDPYTVRHRIQSLDEYY